MKVSARKSVVDPILDRNLVSTAEGALPVHSRICVELKKGTWEPGLITQTWSALGTGGKPIILYKVAFESTGREQEVDLSVKAAKLFTSHAADTPRLQRKASSLVERGGDTGPVVGVTNIPSPSKLSDLKVPDLRRMCNDLGLESKGSKKVCAPHIAGSAGEMADCAMARNRAKSGVLRACPRPCCKATKGESTT